MGLSRCAIIIASASALVPPGARQSSSIARSAAPTEPFSLRARSAAASAETNVDVDCASKEECLALVEIYSREASTLRGDAALLSDQMRAAAAARAVDEETFKNNVLPLETETGLRTTLRLGSDDAFLRAGWEFLEGGAAKLTEVSGKPAAATLNKHEGGWAVTRAPQQNRGRGRDAPDVVEMWCWITRGGATEKVTLRATCMPRADADAIRDATADAAAAARAAEKDFEDAQHAYKRERDEGQPWYDTLFGYRALIKQHEVWGLKKSVARAWAELALAVDGAVVSLGGEEFVLGRRGEFAIGEPPNPLALLAAQLVPFAAAEPGELGTFAAW
mmetsp:Transcript_32014/g.98818  ORF Transcript_32014/g.98818 Transcript_32014/m.98818 type:complete len:333 (-) Transcript_32014:79-1077(-)